MNSFLLLAAVWILPSLADAAGTAKSAPVSAPQTGIIAVRPIGAPLGSDLGTKDAGLAAAPAARTDMSRVFSIDDIYPGIEGKRGDSFAPNVRNAQPADEGPSEDGLSEAASHAKAASLLYDFKGRNAPLRGVLAQFNFLAELQERVAASLSAMKSRDAAVSAPFDGAREK